MRRCIIPRCGFLLVLLLLWNVAVPAFASVVERRSLPAHGGFYLLFKPDKFDPKQKYDLLVCLHGAGDTAENFARVWKPLVDKRANLLLAAPQGTQPVGPGYTWAPGHVKFIVEVITDATTNCGANPKHVMLVGFSAGGICGFNVLASAPHLLACFGGIGTGFPNGYNDTYEKRLKMGVGKVAVYYSVGTQDGNFGGAYNNVVAKLRQLGFTLKTERPNCGHTVTPAQINNMMAFFDSVLKKNDEVKPDVPTSLPQSRN